MTNAEFETTTLFQFNCRLKGWQQVQERNERQQIENARMMAKAIWLSVPWKGNKIPDVLQVFPMPWDPKPEVIEQSERDIAIKVYKTKKAFGLNTKVNSDRAEIFEKYRAELEKEFGKLS